MEFHSFCDVSAMTAINGDDEPTTTEDLDQKSVHPRDTQSIERNRQKENHQRLLKQETGMSRETGSFIGCLLSIHSPFIPLTLIACFSGSSFRFVLPLQPDSSSGSLICFHRIRDKQCLPLFFLPRCEE